MPSLTVSYIVPIGCCLFLEGVDPGEREGQWELREVKGGKIILGMQ